MDIEWFAKNRTLQKYVNRIFFYSRSRLVSKGHDGFGWTFSDSSFYDSEYVFSSWLFLVGQS